MKYGFRDILNEDLYKNCNFAVITGRAYVFINMIIDTFKEMAVDENSELQSRVDISDEFRLSSDDERSSNYVDIDTYREVSGSPSINGKWFCVCDYKTLNKKQRGYIETVKRNPSKHGILLVYSTDYKDYKGYLKDNVLATSKRSHLIEVSFVHDATLKTIISEMFRQKGKNIDVNSLRYFITKLGRDYDSLEDMVDSVVAETAYPAVTIMDVRSALKGVENFTMEDFIEELMTPLADDKTTNRKIYRMMAAMVEQYGSVGLANRLVKEIDTLIEFRRYINSGVIPVSISYIYNDCIKAIGKDSWISKISEGRFRRKALLAAQTSLKDLVYMKMILYNAIGQHDEEVGYRAIYELVTRQVISEDRINNIIGVSNIITSSYTSIDSYVYEDQGGTDDSEH